MVGEDWRLIDLANVEHGRVNRAVRRKQSARFRLSLIKNDPPGASSQRAASHSGEISQVPSVFLEKNNTGGDPKTPLFLANVFVIHPPIAECQANVPTQGLACCKSSKVFYFQIKKCFLFS